MQLWNRVPASKSCVHAYVLLILQEKQYLEAVVARIAELRPDVLVVEQSVARHAQVSTACLLQCAVHAVCPAGSPRRSECAS